MASLDNIPIGKPKKDVNIYIIDENLNQLEEGKTGEILITGSSVANGYLNSNSRGFIKYNHSKAYLTGDLGYFQNGILYYVGRCDKQIKYKGYRIELSDIEKNIASLENIEKVLVSAKKNKQGKVIKLIAFITLKEKIEKCEIEKMQKTIKEELEKKIPSYMCPNIKIIENFPLNQNGKCDEKKLLEEYL